MNHTIDKKACSFSLHFLLLACGFLLCVPNQTLYAQQHDTHTEWDEELGQVTQQLKLEGNMRQGMQVTLINGMRHHAQMYDLDKPVGRGETYWQNGHVHTRFTRDASGQLHGAFHRYYRNNKLKETLYYRHGELQPGTIRTFYPNGRLAAVRCYQVCTPADDTPNPHPTDNPDTWPRVGSPVPAHFVPDSTWLLYDYRGNLHRERTYACAKIVSDKTYRDTKDTLVKGSNPMLGAHVKKNVIVTLDSLNDPLIIKKIGKYGTAFGHEDWVNWRRKENYILRESYYISRMRQTTAHKTYYASGTTRQLVLHQPGEHLRQVRTFYPNGKLKEAWEEDLSGNAVGEYTRYWVNGKLHTLGLYTQDSTQVHEELVLKAPAGQEFAHRTYPSRRHGTWRYYDHKQTPIRTHTYDMGRRTETRALEDEEKKGSAE